GLEERPPALFRPVGVQEVLADPVSGTTRYQVMPPLEEGTVRIERLVAPPGASALSLPPVGAGAVLTVAVCHGRLNVRMDEHRWSVGEGDSVTLRGPAEVVVEPFPGELGVAYLVTARRLSDGG
ncbi:MAG: hypothetical protein QHJ73_04860, partial [Armatimonadota bacterium]|nr:hypothetical protein [Armatimonadota bacterium]